MSLLIKNLQNSIKINLNAVGQDVFRIRQQLNLSDLSLSLIFVSDDYIKKLNKLYKKKDYVTDILSFPELLIENKINKSNGRNLGDIYLAPSFIQQKYKEQALHISLQILIIHGMCHLIGYDHNDDKCMIEMQEIEDAIYNKFILNNPPISV